MGQTQRQILVAPVDSPPFQFEGWRVVERLEKAPAGGFFLVMPLSALFKQSMATETLIRRSGKPKMFFVQLDVDCNSLLERQQQKPWKDLVGRTFAFSDWHQVARIVHASSVGKMDETIATAFVEDDTLVVFDCHLKRYEVKFAELRSLSPVVRTQRSNFQIGEWGEHLTWTDCDVQVDIIDAIRYRKEPGYRNKRDISALCQNPEYGRSIKKLRRQSGLTRADIESRVGLSAKTVQRVEDGTAELSAKTLIALARAHGMDTTSYLHALVTVRARAHTD